MKMDVEVNIDAERILKKYGLGHSKEAQKALAEDVERLCQPYVPMSAGSGAHMVNAARVTDEEIIYPGPYAHYQYVGEVMAGRAPKHYTGRPIDYHGGPMRGKEWDKRMMADKGKEVERNFENYLRRRNT